MQPPPLGRHLVLELYGCPADLLDDPERLPAIAVDAVRASGATILDVRHHRFHPQGVTVVVMVAESHLSIHTWPEHGYAGVDFFTCGDHVDPRRAAEVLLTRIAPARHDLRLLSRGEDHAPLPGGAVAPAERTGAGLYDGPEFVIASAAFDPAPQVAFLRACADRFGLGPLRSGVELACGAAPLAVALAAGGVRMTAVDASAAMLEGAARSAAERGVDVTLVRADMVRHRATPPVDFVTSLGLNTSYLTTGALLVEHLEAVADSLRPGGLYVADFEHVLHRLPPPVRLERPWLVYQGGPLYVLRARGVEIRYADGELRYDPIEQRFRTWNTVIRDGAARRLPSEGKVHLPQEVRARVEQTRRFDFMGWFADYRLDAPFDGHPEADRFVLVLRRR